MSRAELAQEIESGGSAVRWLPGSRGVTLRKWYNVYGEELTLPTDAWSLERYMRKGYTLLPPMNPLPKPTIDPADAFKTPAAMQADAQPDEEEEFGKFLAMLDRAGFEVKRKEPEPIEPEQLTLL